MDTLTIIKNRMSALSDLNTRQDDTAKLLYWRDNPYQLLKPDGKTKIDDAISVTPNSPAVFLNAMVADLMGAKWQVIIEGKLSGRQQRAIESFLDDNWAMADEFIRKRFGWSSLRDWLCNHVCARWAIGVRWLSGVEDGEYKVDCLPVDMRWTPFEFGGKSGLRWVAYITRRSTGELQEEYKKELSEKGITISGAADVEVKDYWDSEKNEVWIEDKLVISQPNPFGYPPFVISIPPTGFMLRDAGYLKHEGEDMLFLNKGLYEEWARALSLEATHGYAGLYPSYEKERGNLDGSPSQPVPKLDTSLDVLKGERHFPVPRGDINIAGRETRRDIAQMLMEGGYIPPRDYTTPPSAVLVATEMEIKGKLLNPRRRALQAFSEQLSGMIINQFLASDKSEILAGRSGKKRNYSVALMGDPDKYTISYQIMSGSKRQEMANLVEFSAVYGKLPLKWNLTNILQADDPDGIVRELELEQAKNADPAIALAEMGVRYAEEAEDLEDETERELKNFESMLLIERAVSIIKQRQQPAPPPLPQQAQVPQVEEAKPNLQGLMALPKLMGQGAGGGRQRQPKEVAL